MASCSKIAIDTNMLLYVIAHKIDLFSELRKTFGNAKFVVPKSVLSELQKLESTRPNSANARRARIAQQLLKLSNAKIIEISKNADKDLLSLAKKGYIVATNDGKLKKLIKSCGGKVIYLRKKKILEVS